MKKVKEMIGPGLRFSPIEGNPKKVAAPPTPSPLKVRWRRGLAAALVGLIALRGSELVRLENAADLWDRSAELLRGGGGAGAALRAVAEPVPRASPLPALPEGESDGLPRAIYAYESALHDPPSIPAPPRDSQSGSALLWAGKLWAEFGFRPTREELERDVAPLDGAGSFAALDDDEAAGEARHARKAEEAYRVEEADESERESESESESAPREPGEPGEFVPAPPAAGQARRKSRKERAADLQRCLGSDAGALAGQGRFARGEFLLEGPCADAGLSQWFFRSEQVCDVLQRVELHVIGQSTERRLVHALQDMVLGRREALRRDLSAPANRTAQLVFDKIEFVPNRERGDEQVADALDACLSVSYRKATMWEDVLEAAHAVVAAAPERRGKRRTVVLFQFGLYALAGGWLRANNTRLSALRLSEWLKRRGGRGGAERRAPHVAPARGGQPNAATLRLLRRALARQRRAEQVPQRDAGRGAGARHLRVRRVPAGARGHPPARHARVRARPRALPAAARRHPFNRHRPHPRRQHLPQLARALPAQGGAADRQAAALSLPTGRVLNTGEGW